MFRFTIRDVLWLMVVVGLAVGWWRDRQTAKSIHRFWADHVSREHYLNPNDYKRLLERDDPYHWLMREKSD